MLLKEILNLIQYQDRKEKELPKVIPKEEIKIIIENIHNQKHKLIISFLYSSGFRLSEIVNLKRNDVNIFDNTILVKHGKGRKDRITLLSEKIKSDLTRYLLETKFKSDYLFEGRNGKYTKKSVQEILKKLQNQLTNM